ncbi:MAG: hypothetical protein KAR35_00680 [Candidatus Heimdallarchaeota archaeon]|nr:hypothetical protein [Candidatus Heimdallarchaeota archaeon]MCK5047867.1 hypothetical protein [Candidatus Heimdallarchaeota archaeon]
MAKLGMIMSSVLVGLGLILFIAGPVANVMVMSALDDGIDDAVRKDADFFDNTSDEDFVDWLSNHDADDAPKYYKYYLWNMTNVDDIKTNTSQTPEYEEIGPYVYQKFEDIDPATIVYDDTDGTVSYGKDSYMKYVASESGAGLNHTGDVIYNFNPAYLGIIAQAMGDEKNIVRPNLGTTLASVMAGAVAGGLTEAQAEAQWGNNSLVPAVPSSPAFAANWTWTSSYSLPFLGISQPDVHALLYDIGQLSWTTENGTLALYNASAYAAYGGVTDYLTLLAGATGIVLNGAQFEIIMNYYEAYLYPLTAPTVFGQIAAAKADYIPGRTVNEWLFTFVDMVIYAATGDLDAASTAFFTNVTDSATDTVTKYVNPDDIKMLNYEIENDGITVMPYWQAPINVNGTGATAWYPGVEKEDVLVAWNSDTMRNLDFEYMEDYELYGIDTYKFGLAPEVLDVDPFYYQSIKGLANMSVFKSGIPIFLSKPHFGECGLGLEMDSWNQDKHDTWVAVEPLTGAVLEGHKRLQVSLIAPNTTVHFPSLIQTFQPLVWAEEAAVMTEQNAKDFKEAIYDNMDLADTLKIAGLGAGLVLVGLGAVVYALVVRKSSA